MEDKAEVRKDFEKWLCGYVKQEPKNLNKFQYKLITVREAWREQQKKIDELEREVRRLAERDGNATIELCYTSKYTPFEREELTVVDFSHADNVYVVRSRIFTEIT